MGSPPTMATETLRVPWSTGSKRVTVTTGFRRYIIARNKYRWAPAHRTGAELTFGLSAPDSCP